MKFSLIIVLFALVAGTNTSNNGLDIFLCILKNEKIYEQALNIIDSIQTKDVPTIISTLFSAYAVIKENVMECIEEKPILRTLSGCVNQKYYDICISKCIGMLHMICKKDCYNCWCL